MNKELGEEIKELIENAGIYVEDRKKLHKDIMEAIERSYVGDVSTIRKNLGNISDMINDRV